MKRLYKYIVASLLFGAMMSCESFLEEEPFSFLSEGNFYQTQADAISATDVIYASIATGNTGWYWQRFLMASDLATDDAYADPGVGNRGFQEASRITYLPNNTVVNSVWLDHFQTIQYCNVVITKVNDELSISERLKGEAKFVRALSYFNLVRLYGPVPLFSTPTESLDGIFEGGRNSIEEIYAQVEQDLIDAEAALPTDYSAAEKGRPTSGAAATLLAKVYLTMAGEPLNDASKYQLAANKAQQVINSGQYALTPNYQDAFLNEFSIESIFEVVYKTGLGAGGGGEGSLLGINTFPRNARNISRGNAILRPTPDLYNSYLEGDNRREWGYFDTLAVGEETAAFDPHFFKWVESDLIEQGLVMNDGGRNFPVLRYADVLLMFAEASNEANNGPNADALNAINEVRQRAGIAPLTSGVSYQDFQTAVWQERRWELFCEGHRWFDLKRTGRLIDKLQGVNDAFADIEKSVESKHTLWPIPQREIDIIDGLQQNPGW